jgi:hypothetical protein
MRKIYTVILALYSICLQAQTVTLTNSTYTQNFDGLANTGTSSILPTGWLFSETGTNANTTYNSTDGTLNSGDTYSYGVAAASERAFGTLQSGSLISTIGCGFTNNSGATYTSITITFTGEQWRLGTNTAGRIPDTLLFQYSTDATSLTTGTWVSVPSLNFYSPVVTGTTGALDGNAAINRTNITFTITVSIPNGSSFYIRWNDFNVSGADDGLAIDDFSLTPNVAASVSNIIRNPNYVKIAGNPGSELNIQFNEAVSSEVHLQFFSVTGEIVLQKRLGRITEGQVERISMAHLPKGLYLLSIKSKEGTFTTKVVN